MQTELAFPVLLVAVAGPGEPTTVLRFKDIATVLADGSVVVGPPGGSSGSVRLRVVSTGFEVIDAGFPGGVWHAGTRPDAPRTLRAGEPLLVGRTVLVPRLVTEAELAALAAERERSFTETPTLSPDLARTNAVLRSVARRNADLLLVGETGTGKEVYARAIHRAAQRTGSLVACNCANMQEMLLDAEIFGSKRGAFTGCDRDRKGLIADAEGGTLFLDEIGELSAIAQPKFLRVLQERTYRRIGDAVERRADVMILAATNRPVNVESAAGGSSLRSDLLARFGPEPIRLLPLKQRMEDFVTLTGHLLGQLGQGETVVDQDALALMLSYSWPGNIRELAKVLEWASALADDRGHGGRITSEDLPSRIRAIGTYPDQAAIVRREEITRNAPVPGRRLRRPRPSKAEIADALDRSGGSVPRAARLLGRTRESIWRWIREDAARD
jgi:transcriptional regulator with PAS, ATPase and Fis domain